MNVLYIVMPAYNEEENIEDTVRAWYPIVERHNQEGRSRLIVFNDGSMDGTSEQGKKLMAELPLFRMIDKPNSGHGPTVIYAYNYAISEGADYVFQTDSDGQTDPDEFEVFWETREQYDGVFGERAGRQDGKSRAFVEKVVCTLLRLYFGVKVPDANAPFRLMKAEALQKYLTKLPQDYYIPNIMLTAYFAYYQENILFVPVTFKERQGGVNSMDVGKIFGAGWRALKDFRVFRREMRNEDVV